MCENVPVWRNDCWFAEVLRALGFVVKNMVFCWIPEKTPIEILKNLKFKSENIVLLE